MSVIHLQSLQLVTILVSFQSNPHKNDGPRIEINEEHYTPRFIIVTLPYTNIFNLINEFIRLTTMRIQLTTKSYATVRDKI